MSKEKMIEIKKYADDKAIELTYSLGLDKKYDIASENSSVRNSGIDYLKRIFERVALMDGNAISGVAYEGWGAPDYIVNTKQLMLERSVKSMKKIIKTAEDNGIYYSVEAVNRFESCLINTAEEALDYVDRVESTHIGVLLDTYHMNIEENNIGDAIRLAGNKLSAFQALAEVGYKERIVSEPFVMMGGEVGRDIKVWRNLEKISEEFLDQEADYLLNYEKEMLKKYNMG